MVIASRAATVTAPCRAPRAAAVMCTTSMSSGRPGSCTASAAIPWTCARVGMTTTWMPLASASWAAASATPIESGSLGSTTTSWAPVSSMAAEQLAGARAAAGTPLDHDGPGLAEQLVQAGTGRDDDQLATQPLTALVARLLDLFGEVGDLDTAGRTGTDARLDGGADVVDVHVHVPQALPADHDQGVAERGEGLAQGRDGVVVGLEEVHHLVRRPTLDQVTARDPRDRDRRGAGVAGCSWWRACR